MFVLLTTHNFRIYALGSPQNGISLELKKTIDIPDVMKAMGNCTFRAVRFHPSERYLFTVLNGVATRSNKSRNPSRQSFICRWDTETWIVDRQRKVGDRGVTCFDISPDGRFLAFGSSDLSIGILDATTLIPIVTILKAHEFPPTTIRFNPTSTLLVTGSADNSIRIVNVPQHPGSPAWGLMILFAIIVVLLGLGLHKYL